MEKNVWGFMVVMDAVPRAKVFLKKYVRYDRREILVQTVWIFEDFIYKRKFYREDNDRGYKQCHKNDEIQEPMTMTIKQMCYKCNKEQVCNISTEKEFDKFMLDIFVDSI